MATDIIKVEGKYRVFEQGSDKVFGTHDTRPEAEAQMRAIEHGSRSHNDQPTPGTRTGKNMRLNSSYEPEPIDTVYVDGKPIATGQ